MAKTKSAKQADKIFNYKDYENKDELREAVNNYFANLPDTNKKPFDCHHLRVLTESIGIIFPDRPSKILGPSDLICTYNAEKGLSESCRFGNFSERGVKYEDGKLKLYCHISEIEVIVEPVRTEN